MEKNPSQIRWSIFDFYKKAWVLIKKDKRLLLLGALVMLFVTTSSNFNSSNYSSNSSETQQTQIQGESPYPDFTPIVSELISGVQAVPVWVLILLGVGVVAYVMYAIVFGFVVSTWCESSLIYAVDRSHREEPWTFLEVIQYAMGRIKSMIWIAIVPMLIFVLILMLCMVLPILLYAIHNTLLTLVGSIVIICIFFVFIFLTFKFGGAVVLAKRICVIEKVGGKDSFLQGWKLSTSNLLKMMRLGLSNAFFGGLATIVLCIPALIGVAVIAMSVMTNIDGIVKVVLVSLSTIVVGVNILFAIMFFPILLTTIKYIAWQYAFTYFKQERK